MKNYFDTSRQEAAIRNKLINLLTNKYGEYGSLVIQTDRIKGSRRREVVCLRIATCQALLDAGMLLTTVGRIMGRDHTSIIHSRNSFKACMDTKDADFYSQQTVDARSWIRSEIMRDIDVLSVSKQNKIPTDYFKGMSPYFVVGILDGLNKDLTLSEQYKAR